MQSGKLHLPSIGWREEDMAFLTSFCIAFHVILLWRIKPLIICPCLSHCLGNVNDVRFEPNKIPHEVGEVCRTTRRNSVAGRFKVSKWVNKVHLFQLFPFAISAEPMVLVLVHPSFFETGCIFEWRCVTMGCRSEAPDWRAAEGRTPSRTVLGW